MSQYMSARVMDCYDTLIVKRIMEKYGLSEMQALRAFICSKTHQMLAKKAYALNELGPAGVFDMWECEKVTGDPRNSLYIRGE